MENSRTCEVCIVNVHRAPFVKHMRSKKHLENIEQIEMIIPDWLFKEEQAPIRKQIEYIYISKTLQQLAIKIIKLTDKKLDKETAEKMINPY